MPRRLGDVRVRSACCPNTATDAAGRNATHARQHYPRTPDGPNVMQFICGSVEPAMVVGQPAAISLS